MKKLFIMFMCPLTIVINQSNEEITSYDMDKMLFNRKRCKVAFKDAPCLKKFIKRSHQNYWAICGKKEKLYQWDKEDVNR